jgi:hypothetical protein
VSFITMAEEDRMRAEQKTTPCPDFRRAGGGCICSICGKEYREHPHNDPWFWLHKLCDGSHVKL